MAEPSQSMDAVPPEPSSCGLPAVRAVGFDAPLRWLGAGWRDMWRQPGASLFYGVCVAIAGAVILGVTARLPYLFTAAISGFLLVAPMLATGLYELSRRYLAGEPAPLVESMTAWKRNPSGLIGFGLLSLLAGTAWQVISVVLVALFYKGSAMAPLDMVREILVKPDVVRLLPKLLWHMDEPIADSAFVTTYLVSEFARKDVKVILSGVGGDELFGGYRRYLGEHYMRYVNWLPQGAKRGAAGQVGHGRSPPVRRHDHITEAPSGATLDALSPSAPPRRPAPPPRRAARPASAPGGAASPRPSAGPRAAWRPAVRAARGWPAPGAAWRAGSP